MDISRRSFMAVTTLLAVARPDLLFAEETSELLAQGFARENLTFAHSNDVNFGGFFGSRYRQSLTRLSEEPIDKIEFVLDDVNFNQKRRFFNYSGDISGRYIEVASLTSTKDKPTTPILHQVIDEIIQYQKPDGHFGRDVDWEKPVDVAGSTDQSLEMPILWGNGRLILGLFAAYERFGNEKALGAAKKMADFYVNIVSQRFCDPSRMDEYIQTAKGYAAAYVTCVFHGIEGLVRAFRLTGEQKYLDCAIKMADFHEEFDTLPVGHSHGSISAHEALVLLYESTGNKKYLDRVLERWEEVVSKGYLFPGGGVCERFKVKETSDEGCSEADWLRLNLMIWRNTGEVKYLDFAEKMLYNEYQMNQWHTGGFGHRHMLADDNGCFAWGLRYAESYWCCSYHGPLGYYELKEFFAVGSMCPQTNKKRIYYNFPVDFVTSVPFKDESWTIQSRQIQSRKNVPIVTQLSVIDPDGVKFNAFGGKIASNSTIQLAIRIPEWCDKIEIVDVDGNSLDVNVDTSARYALVEVDAPRDYIVSYHGRPFVEDRRFNKVNVKPNSETQGVLRFGPHVLVSRNCAENTIPKLTISLNSDGSFDIPESLTTPYEMTNEERDRVHAFVFDLKFE